MNAIAMVRRCGLRQCGTGAAPMVYMDTVSHEASYIAPADAYLPEEPMGEQSRPLPVQDTEAWA